MLRLVDPAIHRYIRQLELGRDALPLYRLLRRNPCKLDSHMRWKLRCWLADKPALRELWAPVSHPRLPRRQAGANGKAKLVIRRAYGYKSFRNYRLRLLNSCD